jgi:hypothetical protein
MGCADRCSYGMCDMLATKSCQRCRRKLCVTHRTVGDKRCVTCERTYDERLPPKRKWPPLEDGDRALDAFFQIIGLVVGTAVLTNFHLVFFPLGFYTTLLVVNHYFGTEPHKPLRRSERKRFLAERPD